jgi:hypothetical protein
MLAAGGPQLPRSVRRELARLLLGDTPDRFASPAEAMLPSGARLAHEHSPAQTS